MNETGLNQINSTKAYELINYNNDENIYVISESAMSILSSLRSNKIEIVNILGNNNYELFNVLTHSTFINENNIKSNTLYFNVKEVKEGFITVYLCCSNSCSSNIINNLRLIGNILSSSIVCNIDDDVSEIDIATSYQINFLPFCCLFESDKKSKCLQINEATNFIPKVILIYNDDKPLSFKGSFLNSNYLDKTLYKSNLEYKDITTHFSTKKYKKFEYTGNCVLSYLVNIVYYINCGDMVPLQTSIDNILLSEAKTISEDLIYSMINAYKYKIEEVGFPIDYMEIIKLSYNELTKTITTFNTNVNDYISCKSSTSYIKDMYNKLNLSIEENIKTNKQYIEEYLKQEFNGIENELRQTEEDFIIDNKSSNYQIEKQLEKIKSIFEEGFLRIVDIPNMSDEFKLSYTSIKTFVSNSLITRLFNLITKHKTLLEEDLSNNNNDFNDELKNKKKILNDQANNYENQIKEKNTLINELEENIFKLNNEISKLKKDFTNQSLIYSNDLNIEKEKFLSKELNYIKSLKDKDDKISLLEKENLKLNVSVNDIQLEYNNKIINLKNEINKLTIENDKNKLSASNQNVNSFLSNLNSNQSKSLMSAYKSIKELFTEIKNSLSSLDKEKNTTFKFKSLDKLVKESNLSYDKLNDELKEIKTDLNKNISSIYEEKISNLKEELNEVSLSLAKLEYAYNDEKDKIELLKKTNKNFIEENEGYKSLIEKKEKLVSLMKETNLSLENKCNIEKKNNDDLELKLHKARVECEMVKDEIETISFLIEDIVTKSYNRFKSHLNMLSNSNKAFFESLVKRYRIF